MKNIQAVLVLLLIIGTSAAAQTKAADSKIVFTAALTAAQESPADTSHATGTAWAVLSEDSRQLTYHVTYARLTSKFAASHFHIGSSGTPGPVVQPIKFSGNTASGTWTNIPDSVMAALLRGGIYINVHSSNYPAGEIRGQLKPAGGIPFVISLDPMQVTSAVTSEASGTGWAVLNKSDSALTLTYGITIAGLSSAYAASHFHMGAAGQSGGVIQPITFTDSSAYGTWSKIPDADILSLLKNGLYVNVHSSNYPNGEIRGQVIESAPVSFTASLDGAQETPSITTNAAGTGVFVLDSTLTSLNYNITYAGLSDVFTASHFHLGAPGVPGGVVQAITYSGNTANGSWINIPDSILIALIKGNIYANVHSNAHKSGEIRGALKLNDGIAFFAALNGLQSVPSDSSRGSGTAWLALKGDTLNYRITIAGLSSPYTMSHFHNGKAGTNAGVVKPIILTDSTATASWDSLNNEMLNALVSQGLYINVHTQKYPAGEIRGQVLPVLLLISQPVTSVDNKKAFPEKYTLEQNYPNPFNPVTTISYTIPKAGRVTIKVFNLLGQETALLVNENQNAGNYKVSFDGSRLPSGTYFYRMEAGDVLLTKKLMILK